MPQNDELKETKTGLVSDAQNLFNRLNGRRDRRRAAMQPEIDVSSENALEEAEAEAFSPVADMSIPMPEIEESLDKGELTEEELRELFERCFGDGANSERSSDETEYEVCAPADIKKNIDEAKRYIDELTAKKMQDGEDVSFAIPACEDTTGGFAIRVRDTQQLDAFAPDASSGDADEARMQTVHAATEDVVVPDFTVETDMMKQFGMDISDETKLFEDVPLIGDDTVTQEPTDSSVRQNEKTDEPIGFEYTSPAQTASVFSVYKSKYAMEKVRMTLVVAVALLLGLLENVSAVADIFGSNVNVIAVDWGLSIICAALVFDRIFDAAKKLIRAEFIPDTVTLVAFTLSVIATGVALFAAPAAGHVYLYNFPFAVCALMSMLASLISLRRDVYSFKIVSSSQPKSTLRCSAESEDVPEKKSFFDYLGEDERICTIQQTDFVQSYFKHRAEKPRGKFALHIFLPVSLGFSVFLFLMALLVKDYTGIQSFGAMYSAFLLSAPIAIFAAHCYPLYLAARRAYGYRSAIVSDKTQENYEKVSVIAFRDEDAFPAGRAKVKSLKLYADRGIESVMYYASSVYSELGGPLAPVFRQATLNGIISKRVEILELSYGGVCAMVDGRNVVIGCPDYMEEQCFELIPDEGDEQYDGISNKRILYLACDQIVIAKFYVCYTTTADFLYMSNRLANAGVGTAIRTADPGIDDGLLAACNLNPEKYPVRVIGGVLPQKIAGDASATNGGIVSVGTTKELIKTFLLCDRLGDLSKIHFVLMTVAAILGAAVMLLLLLTGHLQTMISVFPALYQLFWLIPIGIVSRLSI